MYTAYDLGKAYKKGVISEELSNQYFTWVNTKFDTLIDPKLGHTNTLYHNAKIQGLQLAQGKKGR